MSLILLPLFIFMILVAMIIPLSPEILDCLLIFNLAGSCLLLFTSIYVNSSLKLTSLPSLLLLGTLFRVALNISSTRSILTKGDAGALIDFFGTSVTGGNILVGFVVFVIITLMQFLVVSKGSERTAEVAARFSLDALPGRQMAIDSDLRSGILTTEEARLKRQELQSESKLYAALDGAMKFIKGDVLLGILITFVNLFAGVLYGYFSLDLELFELVNKFFKLAVGDALVSQISSLLNAVTAGLVITKVDNNSFTQSEIVVNEILQSIESKFILAIILLLLAFVPGVPKVITIVFSIVLFISCLFSASKNKIKVDQGTILKSSVIKIKFKNTSKINFSKIQEEFFKKVGFRFTIDIENHNSDRIEVYLRDILISDFADDSNLEKNILKLCINYAGEILTDHVLKELIIENRSSIGDMISTIVPSAITPVRLLKIFKMLLVEGVSLKQLDLIIETIATFSSEKDNSVIVAEIRVVLKREISLEHADNFEIKGAVLDAQFEKEIMSGNSYEAISKLIARINQKPEINLLITSKRSRMGLVDLLRGINPRLKIIAFEEIDQNYKVSADEIITLN